MFKFLKEKLKKATSLFSKKVEEAAEKSIEEGIGKEKELPKEEITKEKIVKEKIKEEIKEKYISERKEKKEEKQEERKEEKEEKKGIFKKITERITKQTISEQKFDSLFWDLEVILMENNVAVDVIEKIKDDLKKNIVDVPLDRGKILKAVNDSLKESIEELFSVEPFDLVQKIKGKKPFVIVFVGINGSGKTTTIAKVARLLQKNGLSCVIAASDTFRAASIEQLQKHADSLKVKLVKHNYGADPAAVAFDAVRHAEAHRIDAVLIDTAGRLHSNVNLMDELKKIVRVAKPDLKIFVGESITGNDCVEQAKQFNDSVGIDGIILAKADIDEKGGAAVSISYVTKKPILYLGVGQGYEDLKKFNSGEIIKSIGLEA